MLRLTCSTPLPAALVIAALSLSGCVTAGSEPVRVCPPVVQYDRQTLARAADEIEALPPGAALERLMADYAVMRDQARACLK